MNSESRSAIESSGEEIAADTFAHLTGKGRGAVGVVWMRGGRALDVLAVHFCPAANPPLAARPSGSITYGVWRHAGESQSAAEDVVIVRLGPEEFEVHIHGGSQSRLSIHQALSAAGFVEQPGADWLASRASSELAALLEDMLLQCETERSARWLLNQQRAWEQWCEAVERKVAGGDYSGVCDECASVLERRKWALHLTEPWLVVLGGEPNVGKSSLVNALSGFARAIVHSSPGTTRDLVTQRVVLAGWLVELVDTAGQRLAGSAIEGLGIERAREVWKKADCRVAVEEATGASGEFHAAWEPPPDLRVVNKTDLLEAPDQEKGLHVSALTGEGIEELQRAILKVLVKGANSTACPLPIGARLPELLESLRRAGEEGEPSRLTSELRRLSRYCGRGFEELG
ncbi:MAG: GTPase [Planctomycetota bacterium]